MTDTSPAEVPRIDIGALYGDDPVPKARVAAEIGAACDEIGFFYAVNHHVPAATIEAARAKANEFFALPVEERLRTKADRNNRGYREMGDTVHKSGRIFARDSFDLGFPMSADDPEVVAGTPLYAENKWPELPGFRDAVQSYYDGSFQLGLKILEGFAIHLGQQPDFFSRHFTRPIADMVLNHYYGHDLALSLGATEVASGAHTDHGIVTILWQDDSGGLEVLDGNDNWIAVPPVAGSYVINVGELMRRWSNGRFRATVHRVIHTQNASRLSMPLFCNPDFRTVVDPRQLGVADEDARFAPVLSGDYLVSRFQATRKSWGAEKPQLPDLAGVEMALDY